MFNTGLLHFIFSFANPITTYIIHNPSINNAIFQIKISTTVLNGIEGNIRNIYIEAQDRT